MRVAAHAHGYTTAMTTPAQDPPPVSLQEEADEPTQDTVNEQRDVTGDEPSPGDAGGHS